MFHILGFLNLTILNMTRKKIFFVPSYRRMSRGVGVLELAFRYDHEKEEWVQCTDKLLIEQDIERLPTVLLVKYVGYDNDGYYVRCPYHCRDEMLQSSGNGEFITVDGCRFDGLVGTIEKQYTTCFYYVRCRSDKRYRFVPFRWRVYQRGDDSPINIAADVLYIDTLFSNSSMNWKNISFSIDVVKKKMIISKVRTWNGERPQFHYAKDMTVFLKEWTEITGIEIPDIVVDMAMNSLQEGIQSKYGIKPSTLSRVKGALKIMAFVKRPFDLNIVFLKNFLGDFINDDQTHDNFDMVFPYEQKDNYRELCRLLEIKPPKSLRKAYTFNPYAIVWYMIFRQWGIEDVNYMQRFLYLGNSICGLRLQNFRYNKENKKVICCAENETARWESAELYCKWLKQRNKVKRMLNWFYTVSTEESLSDMQWDILRAFRDYNEQLSDAVKNRLLCDGLTTYVHNDISNEITNISQGSKHYRIRHGEEILKYECKINQYEFRLVHDTAILSELGSIFHNCVATYEKRVINHESIIMYVLDGADYLACIEINGIGHVIQALGKYNKNISGPVSRVISFWAGLNRLNISKVNFGRINKADIAKDFSQAIIKPLSHNRTVWDETQQDELSLSENELEGILLQLAERWGFQVGI